MLADERIRVMCDDTVCGDIHGQYVSPSSVIRRRRLHRPPFGRNVARSQIIPHGLFLACFGNEVAFSNEREWKARFVVILLPL